MEDESSHSSSEPKTKPLLETLQRQHKEKQSRIEELKRKKASMAVELEKQKSENPDRVKGFDELSEGYNSRRDQVLAFMAERSKGYKK